MLSFVTQFFNYSYSQNTPSPSPSASTPSPSPTSPGATPPAPPTPITYPNCNQGLTVVKLKDEAIFCVKGEDRAKEIEESLKEISKDPFTFDHFILHPSSNALQEGLRISHNIKLTGDDYIAVKNNDKIEWKQLKSFNNTAQNTKIIDKNSTILHSNSIIAPHDFNITRRISNLSGWWFLCLFFPVGILFLILAACLKNTNNINIYQPNQQDKNALTLPIVLTLLTFFGMLFIFIAFSKLFLDTLTTYFVLSMTIVFGIAERTWTSLSSAKLEADRKIKDEQLMREKRAIEHIAYWDSSIFQEIRQAITELNIVDKINSIKSTDQILEAQAEEIKKIIEHQDTEQRKENDELLQFIELLSQETNQKDEYAKVLAEAKETIEICQNNEETAQINKTGNVNLDDPYLQKMSRIMELINKAIKYNDQQSNNKDLLLKITILIQENKKYPLDVYFRTLCNFWEQTYWLLEQNIADRSMIENSFYDIYTDEYYVICTAFLRSKYYIASSDENLLNQENSLCKLYNDYFRIEKLKIGDECIIRDGKTIHIYQGWSSKHKRYHLIEKNGDKRRYFCQRRDIHRINNSE